jgi:dihydropyrimidinase
MAVRGGLVVLEDAVRRLDIGVADGRIVALAEAGALPQAAAEYEADGLYVLPGGIDSHTHLQWPIPPGEASLDDFGSGTAAAAVGGTTTIIDFVPPPAGEPHWAAAERRLGQARGRAVVDYTFHPVITDAEQQTLMDIHRLIRAGMASFKIYTTSTTPLDDWEIRSISAEIASGGGLAGFHAENHQIITRTTTSVVDHLGTAVAVFPQSRPAVAESESIAMVTHFARELDAPVFIYHVSSQAALQAVQAAARLGTCVRAETCTHYLTFEDSVYTRDDAWKYVITPPIRDAANREQLWLGLADGSLSCVASDHCAYGLRHKLSALGDFTKLPPGSPGIDARLPFTWARGVASGGMTPVQFARVTATNAARTFGLYPAKGHLAVGADADLVVWDAETTWTWPAFPQGLGSDYDSYEGLSGAGLPLLTFVRGQLVAEGGRPVASAAGTGQFVPQAIDTSTWL